MPVLHNGTEIQLFLSRERNVYFVYGISPGLDMAYSKTDEYQLLVQKTKQIQKGLIQLLKLFFA